MIEEVAENIYRIEVRMPGNPLKALNSYFIRGDEQDLLIDIGFKLPECREDLKEGLKKLNSHQQRRNILLTHLHSDHSGLADEFVGDDCHIYMNQVDLSYQEDLCNGDFYSGMVEQYIQAGYPENLARQHKEKNPAARGSMKKVDARFVGLKEGGRLTVGKYTLELIATPGHTPGNSMFWIEDKKIMFTGDNILFDITPNIVSLYEVTDSLGSYLKSLDKSKKYSVDYAFPGHRKPGDYKKRIDEIKEHHLRRIEESLKIVNEYPGSDAYAITAQMKWKIHAKNWDDFPDAQKWFAFGECLAHLDYLRLRGKVIRTNRDDKWVYYPA